jgi:hypothetical protein
MSNWMDGLAASIAAVILLVACVWLLWAWRHFVGSIYEFAKIPEGS